LVIEWGKWADIDALKNDLMQFVTFFSDNKFREEIAGAKDKKMWAAIGKLLRNHGIDVLKIGAKIALAAF